MDLRGLSKDRLNCIPRGMPLRFVVYYKPSSPGLHLVVFLDLHREVDPGDPVGRAPASGSLSMDHQRDILRGISSVVPEIL